MREIMRRMLAAIILLGGFWLLASPASAEMWRCALPDGSEIFTNRTEGLTDCKEYVPEAVLGVLPDRRDSSAIMEPLPTDRIPIPSRGERFEERRTSGQISFETFRMLSTGMTETEVLVRAGPPKHRFRLSIGAIVWSYLNDDWVVEVLFSGYRVASIYRYRPRP